jgi:hypothetical protein
MAGEAVVGGTVEAFVYTEKDGEVVATTLLPKVEVGQFGVCEVVELAGPGAYLDWGLERDLLVPFALQHQPLKVGQTVVVAVDVDDRDRLFGSTRLAEFFERDVQQLAVGQEVELLVYGMNAHGVLLVVDGRYTGLAYHDAVYQRLGVGDRLTGWVAEHRDDRVDVSLQRTAKRGRQDARSTLLAALEANDGWLPLHDRSSPVAIQRSLQMSKKAFKRAVGALYKERLVTLEDGGIRLSDG